MARPYKPSVSSKRLTTHLPAHLAQYVEGVAKMANRTISSTLAEIVKMDFERVKTLYGVKKK